MHLLSRAVGMTVVTSGALLLSACSGIVNPHLSWDQKPGTTAPTFSLSQAVAYADKAKAAYKEALGNQSRLASWLGIGIIPLAAAAGGLGVTGGPPTAIAATGFAGIAAYGIGTWLYSKPYQRAWVAGYNATSCAVDAVLPLRYVESKKSLIESAIVELDTKRDRVVSAINKLRVEMSAAPTSPASELKDARSAVTEADDLLASTAITRANAIKMLQEVDTAGPRLKEAVDRISGQVSGLLVETGPDLQALASIVGGLAQGYKSFVAAPEPKPTTSTPPKPATKKPGEEKAPQLSKLEQAMLDLSVATVELIQAHRTVADYVSALSGTTPVETLRACGVSADQVSIPLSVEPPGTITIDEGSAASVGRVVKGGAAPFAVVLQGALADLSVKQTEPFGASFIVQTSDKTPAGKVTVFVTDRSGNKLFVAIEVAKKSAQEPPSDTSALAALKSLKVTLETKPNVQLPNGVTATVSNVEVRDQERKMYVNILLKRNGTEMSAVEATKVPNTSIQDAIAKTDPKAEVGLKDVVIRLKQNVSQQ